MNEAYEAWRSKFDKEREKTTDDCYTPPHVYEFVKNYFCKYYGIDEAKIIRPFYPGGDYKNEDYTDKVVLDNPPFSIMTEIVAFYQANNIPFIMFCNGTTGTTKMHGLLTYHIGGSVTYENNARVNTGFVTNMDKDDAIVSNIDFCTQLERLTQKHTLKEQKWAMDEISLATVKKTNWVLKKDEIVCDIHKRRKDAFGLGYVITMEAGIRRNEAEKEAGYVARN